MLENLNSILWAVATSVMVMASIYFNKKLSFPQFKLKKIYQSLQETEKKGITPIKTLFLTLAGRIGVGSIAGVALAIYVGGPGTVFWMWFVALIFGVLAYTETLLAIKYKNTNTKESLGGPSYYIKNGLKNRKLAYIYSLIVVFSYLIGFIPIQSNTIVKSVDMLIKNNHALIGIFLSLIAFLIIKGGIRKITKVTNKLVPFMTILYVGMAISVLIIHINKFPLIINQIIIQAFNIKPFLSGFIPIVLIGVQRGIFSNESGIGLGAIAASASNSTIGTKSGYIQVLGVYITTIIICTATAFMILIFNYQNIRINDPNGIEITNLAFNYHFGNLGNLLLVICILLFSFTTILTGYYYCDTSLKFIFKNINPKIIIILTPISVFAGTIISPSTIWQTIDILVAILAIINIYSLYKLKEEIVQYHRKYDKM